jgi:hypothetical protein
MLRCLLVCFCLVFASVCINACSRNNKDFSIIEIKCGTCHSASIVYGENRNEHEWDRIIYAMKHRGLKLNPNEEKAIKDILYKNF